MAGTVAVAVGIEMEGMKVVIMVKGELGIGREIWDEIGIEIETGTGIEIGEGTGNGIDLSRTLETTDLHVTEEEIGTGRRRTSGVEIGTGTGTWAGIVAVGGTTLT